MFMFVCFVLCLCRIGFVDFLEKWSINENFLNVHLLMTECDRPEVIRGG